MHMLKIAGIYLTANDGRDIQHGFKQGKKLIEQKNKKSKYKQLKLLQQLQFQECSRLLLNSIVPYPNTIFSFQTEN